MQETYTEIEQAFLGAALIDPTVLDREPLDENDLYIHRNRFIYRAMRRVLKDSGTLDPLLIQEELRRDGTLEDVGPAYVYELINTVPSALHGEQYAKEIRKQAENRSMLEIATDMARAAQNGGVDVPGIMNRMTNAIRTSSKTNTFSDAREQLKQFVKERMENQSNIWGIPAPWDEYNLITGGLHKGQSVMIYGAPGIGKSVVGAQMCLHAAMVGYRVCIYSLEMTEREYLMRLACMKSRVSERKVKRGKLNEYDLAKFSEALDFIADELPITVSDHTTWTSAEIRADQQKKDKNNRAELVLVDYLALLKDRADNAHERVEHASMAMRDMAKDLDLCALVISSEVKDGTVKGTQEVQHAQNHIWHVVKPESSIENDPLRDLVPTKLRDCPRLGKVPLRFTQDEDVPLLEEWLR